MEASMATNQNRKPVEASDLAVGQVWRSTECSRKIVAIGDDGYVKYRCSDVPEQPQRMHIDEFVMYIDYGAWTLAPQSGGVA